MKIIPITPWLSHGIRPKGVLVNTVVMHATAGSTAAGAISWLKHLRDNPNPGDDASYHFIIDEDGSIYKGVPISKRAFHAGKSVGPQGENVNRYSIGVAFANRNDGLDTYSEAQENAARWLIPQLRSQMDEYKFITTHYAISPGRKTDPKAYGIHALAQDMGLAYWS